MKIPTFFHVQGEPCYPIRYWIFDTFSFMYKKKALMKNAGWYKTLSGDWSNNHLEFLSNNDFQKMTLEELKNHIFH